MKKTAFILLVAVALVIANYCLVRSTKSEAWFSPTGLQSNLARLSALERNPDGKVVLLGSSISGRILPTYFGDQFQPVLNVGLDGGGGASGLLAFMESGGSADIVLLETNGLRRAPKDPGGIAPSITSGEAFWIKTKVPALGANYRPSAVLYSMIKRKRDARIRAAHLRATREGTFPPKNQGPLKIKPLEPEFLKSMLTRVCETQQRVIGINYPSLGETQPDALSILKEFASNNDRFEFLDLAAVMQGQNLSFTDKIHLDADSARLVAQELIRYLDHSESSVDVQNHIVD